jgi:hypothetical protein
MNDENPFDKKGKEKERNGFLCVCYVKERWTWERLYIRNENLASKCVITKMDSFGVGVQNHCFYFYFNYFLTLGKKINIFYFRNVVFSFILIYSHWLKRNELYFYLTKKKFFFLSLMCDCSLIFELLSDSII